MRSFEVLMAFPGEVSSLIYRKVKMLKIIRDVEP